MPRGAFGLKLQAAIALLGWAYRLCKRQIQAILADLLGQSVSTGMVCKTERHAATPLTVPVEAVNEHVRSAYVAGVDETGWRDGKQRAWLWAAVTSGATALRIAQSRGTDALHLMFGEPVGPVVPCDRFPVKKYFCTALRHFLRADSPIS